MYKVSVIVPVYNVENYLERCIESLLNQNFNSKDYEIVLVNDGSTDKSGRICDKYKNVSNISVYHKKNGGLSDARNFGLDNSKSKYVTFVDSDDFVDENYINVLYKLISASNISMSACSTEMIFNDNVKKLRKEKSSYFEIINRHKMMKYVLTKKYGIGVSTWAKMYDRKIFKNIRFPKGKIHEDLLTTPYLIEKCQKIAITNEKNYYYCIRENSITTSSFNLEKDLDLFNSLDQIKTFISKFDSNLTEEFMCRYIIDSFQIIDKIVKSSEKNKNKLIRKIMARDKVMWNNALKNKYLSNKMKLNIYLLKINPLMYIIKKKFCNLLKRSN